MTMLHLHAKTLLLATALGCCLTAIHSEQCVPGGNCKAPSCRCWNDPKIPGNLKPADTPQIVLVSFDYAVNSGNVGLYTSIFDGVSNPNGCPTTGTFFVQNENSDFSVIKRLHEMRHEIGVTTADGRIPSDPSGWLGAFQAVKLKLESTGIPGNQILGSRSPDLFIGGDAQFSSIEQNQLAYDTSCVSQYHISTETMIWPYTYDFVDSTPKCSIGKDVKSKHRGKWQFLVADLKIGKAKCASPSSCSPLINSTQQAFDMLYSAFTNHYDGQRSPFVLYIDPQWLTTSYQYQGTKRFLEFIRLGLDDTWILTNQQALAWIKDPTPTSKIADFAPWNCPRFSKFRGRP